MNSTKIHQVKFALKEYFNDFVKPVVKSIFDDWTNNATYLSPSIQNELLHLIADQIRYHISGKVYKLKPLILEK